MPKKQPRTYILSIGGPLIVPGGEINVRFLKALRLFVTKQVRLGNRFYIVVGGGQTARTYMRSALAVTKVASLDRDLIGIQSTRLNAQLMKAVLGGLASAEIRLDHGQKIRSNKPVVLAAGRLPGHSTDYYAVLMAQANWIKTVINLSNIDYVYDRDPSQYSQVKPIRQISWSDFRSLVGSAWKPGLHLPFDPVASRLARRLGMQVVILNGAKLGNFANYLNGRKFRGTLIG